MKSTTLRINRKVLFLLVSLLGFGIITNAQLKIGDNPTNIQKSSILELESNRQGLLLPRLTDTAAINLLNPPDGMIVFLTTDKSLRLRSNGAWKKIADLAAASSNWALNGNSGTDSLSFIGTVDGKPLIMKTNNAERFRIDASGNVGIGTNNPTAKLDVDGTVKLQSLAAGTSELDVLVLAADGSVYKRTMSSAAFENAIKQINGLQKQTLTITAEASTSKDSVQVESRSADSTIALYLPVQNGASGATRPYGLLTFADWQKIQSGLQNLAIGAVATSADVNGITIDSSATTRTLVLHPADATHPGIVTAGAQTFGGSKTFNDSVTVNGTLNLNNVATNSSVDSVLVINNGVVQKRQVSAAAFGNAIRSINNNRDTIQVFSFLNQGNDLSISANGSDSIRLNVPDAGSSARGVVTTATQTFAGNKTFSDSLSASKSMLVGASGSANSTVQVNGSLSLAISTVSSNYTLTATDNTVLANTSSAAVTISLPASAAIAGRVYTIKKIGTGGLDNELTITPSSGTIEGGANYVIYNDWTYVTIQTDGTNWYVIRK
ncbi:MAG: hypothetical protein WDN26_12245 [Chitinophagaceae bacterium]